MSGRGQTPARATRASTRQNTPLPALQTRQSHAYGAAGKASLQSQVTTSHAAVDEAFTATARDEREPTPAGRRTTTRPKKSQPVVEEPPQPESESEPPTEDGDGERPATSLQDSALYAQHPRPPTYPMAPPVIPPRRDPVPTYPTIPPTGPRRNLPPRQPRQQPQKQQQPPYEPPRWRIFLRTLWRYMPFLSSFFFVYTLMTIGLICSILGLWTMVPLSESMGASRDQFFRGIKVALGFPGYDQPPDAIERMWHTFRHVHIWNETLPGLSDAEQNMQYLINWNLLSRLNATTERLWELEAVMKSYNDTLQSQGEAIEQIQRLLPKGLALVEQNGEWVIPPAFWNALLEKMSGDGAAPLWEKFVSANADHLDSLGDEFLAGKIDAITTQRRLLSYDRLQAALEENRRLIEQSLDEKIEGMRTHLLHETRQEVKEVVKAHFTSNPANVARWNIVNNLEQRMHERNFLSPGLGALVDPRLTSTTFGEVSTLQSAALYVWWMTGLAGFTLAENPKNSPMSALLGWEEATQCWCAEKDKDGHAQLAVQLAHKIHPEYLMIEHIPPEGTLDIAAAPRKWEMWAQVDNKTEAARMTKVLEERQSTFTANQCGDPPKDRASSWVCLASGDYNIHDGDFVQSYPVDYWRSTMHEDVLFSGKFIFKVVENWGSPDHTCLYRLRLTGTQKQAFEIEAAEQPATF